MRDSKSNQTVLRAGAAKVEITPVMGTQIAGDIGRRRPAEVVLEPLFAKALVLDDGLSNLCFLSLDLLAATKEWCQLIRNSIEERFAIPAARVTVHVTQNHAAPSLGHLMVTETNSLLPEGREWAWARGGDDAYHPYVVARVLEATAMAIEQMEPAHIGIARGIDGRFAFNRRYVMRDGSAAMTPGRCNPDILHMEGPSDPEVGVALITNDKLENLAVLLHHTCHPVHGYPMNYISSGWPGAWCDCMEDVLGQKCVAMVVNGCCGNVIHENHLDPDHNGSDYKAMGAGLAQTAIQALKRMTYMKQPLLQAAHQHLSIPMRQIPATRLEKARKTLLAEPMPRMDQSKGRISWDWWYAMSTLDVYNHWGPNARFDYEIQAYRIGDLGLIAVGGEPFVQGQLKIKYASPAPYTFVAHMCNYYVGYIPTSEALDRGGYETWTGLGSKLHPDALNQISDEAIELLESLFGQKQPQTVNKDPGE